jgi:hypothetical protein
MLSALLRAGRYLTAGPSCLSTADSILMSSRYPSIRFCLSTRGRVVPYKTVKALISEPIFLSFPSAHQRGVVTNKAILSGIPQRIFTGEVSLARLLLRRQCCTHQFVSYKKLVDFCLASAYHALAGAWLECGSIATRPLALQLTAREDSHAQSFAVVARLRGVDFSSRQDRRSPVWRPASLKKGHRTNCPKTPPIAS